MNDSVPTGPYGEQGADGTAPAAAQPPLNSPDGPQPTVNGPQQFNAAQQAAMNAPDGPRPPLNAPQPGLVPASGPEQQKSGLRRLFSRRRNVVIAGALAVCVAAGISIGFAATSGSSGSTTTAASFPFAGASGGAGGAGGGSNARSGPEPGGTSGTVSGVSGSSFTLTTTDGQKVTVNESSSTTYENGSSSTTASAITTNTPVLVLGTVNSTTISATQVTIEPANSPYTTANSAVEAFQQGSPSTAKSVGTIPADYTEGQGTIVTGSTANQATVAALAAYPGVLVDRVVQLSDGTYEVHTIGANWPHHVFVNTSFQVVGAN
ncbi:hypothetical protein [Actinospica sp.]|uniref:hypothetical protein n=1 Tax=Actinospica sp. TaxID=1872142 RepID=UPI002C053E29|nr:hypothetical protein [Actinospica sp.]HWG24668.1 hypothetical protein [Actinospica sp.]